MKTTNSPASGCPVLSYSPHERRPIGNRAAFFDQPRADTPVVRNTFFMFMAGLDTVAAALGYALYHFATHPDDQLADDAAIFEVGRSSGPDSVPLRWDH